jgi:DNA-binding transcriptional ArsR family regulator
VITYVKSGWTALGDPTRRTIFELLVEHPCSVGELARVLPVSRPAVSQHLKILKDARLVVDARAGKQRIYRVDREGLASLRSELDRFWRKTLAAYKAVAEQPAEGGTMSTRAADTSVKRSIVVEAPIARAFKVFTEDFGRFKPPEHNMLAVPIAETVFEPRVGGYLYDRGVDGSECRWARVLAYDPPNRVLLSWNITPHWQIETDPDKTSEWEVRFTAETAHRTRVEIEHRNLERHGEGWQGERDGVAGDQGWPLYLQRFAGLLAGQD